MPHLLKFGPVERDQRAMPWTRRGLGAAALAGVLGALGSARNVLAQPRAAGRPTGKRPLPEFSFSDGSGRSKTLADFPGNAFVLNFWATWCPPCVEEMPSLDRLHAALAPDRIQVLPLSSDSGGRTQVEPFYQSHRLRHVGIWIDRRSAAARAFGVHGLPTTVLTDRDGNEVARIEGALDWDLPVVATEIRRLAGPTSSPGLEPPH